MMKLDSSSDGYRLYKSDSPRYPSSTYVVCAEESRAILYSPHIAGKELQERMERLSKIYIKIANEKVLKGTQRANLAEFILLSGGLYYSLARGFREVNGFTLPQCFLGIKRQRVEGSEGHFTAVSTYENFESLPQNATILVGDTIATGATLTRAIADLERAAEEKDGKIEKMAIFSLACSSDAAHKLRKMEEKMREKNKNFKLTLIVSEQLFQLMPDGTDLRFLADGAEMPEETKNYTLEKYGDFLGKEMKCAVFDWGTRCKNPLRHYEEFIEFGEEILKNPKIDEKGKGEIKRMVQETELEMENCLKEL